MAYSYDHKAVESTWREKWSQISLYSTSKDQSKPKKYILDAFPYPSGSGLHVGHFEGYAGSDILSRFYRMSGYRVLHPMGWDAFGLPAENYAIKTGVHPRPNTDKAIETFKSQMNNTGLGFDWDRELATHREDYYRWSQWIFTLLYKKGLAYKKKAMVNWDPVDKTVLANEQVLPDGTGERSGAQVEQKMLSQWFFKITDYADRLLEDLDKVNWPESTKQMQKNWIGKSQGAEVFWELARPHHPEFFYAKDINKDELDYTRSRGSAFIRVKETGEYVVFSKDKSGYVLPGGAAEQSENEFQAAVRESLEEVGIKGLEFVAPIGQCYVYDSFEGQNGCTLDKAYLFEISKEQFEKRLPGEVDDLKFNVELVTLDFLRSHTIDHVKWQIDQIDAPYSFGIKTFTTRLDTIFGVTYLVVAPEHPLATTITTPQYAQAVAQYQEETKKKSQLQRTDLNKDKSGVFTGSYVIHPFTGEQIPVFVADYVLSTYGTGAIMAVPAHDQRDFECTHTFNKLIENDLKSRFNYQESDRKKDERVQSVLYNPETGMYGVQKDSFRIVSKSVVEGEHIEEAFDKLNDSVCGDSDYKVYDLGPDIRAGLPKELNNYAQIHSRLVSVTGVVAEDMIWMTVEDILAGIEELNIRYRDNKDAAVETLYRAVAKAIQLGVDTKHSSEEFGRIFPLSIPEIVTPIFREEIDEHVPSVERLVVRVFVKSKQSGKWLLCTLSEMDNLNTTIVGGIEDGEDMVTAALRELKEEAGIEDAQVLDILDIPVMNIFNVPHKKINRIATSRAIFLEVDTEDITPEEGHTFTWIDRYSFGGKLELDIDTYFWQRYSDESFIFTDYGVLIDSGEYTHMPSEDAREQMALFLESKGQGNLKTTYKLRDWLISRQRYWGAPIPVVYDGDGKQHIVSDDQLPVLLPDDVEFQPSGRSPLIDHEQFHQGAKDQFGPQAVRESDTMDTFMCSSWYFLRYCDPHNQEVFADKEKVSMWGPIDTYIIGAEHTVLHLLYARFFTKVLFDEGLIDFDEPFMNLVHPGIVLAEDSRKMSKRWGNVVNPDDVVEEYGADTLRMYEMFMGPFNQSKPWNVQTIKGVRRFIDRLWNVQDMVQFDVVDELEVGLHSLVKKVTEDVPSFSFNTSVAEFMKFIKAVEKAGKIGLSQWRVFLKTIAPFAPFISEEMWLLSEGRGHEDGEFHEAKSIHTKDWPVFDEEVIRSQKTIIGIQINGKRRGEVEVTQDDTQDSVRDKVMQEDSVQKWLDGKVPNNFIYIPGKIVNIVIK